jgi:glycosyltransferase involved in cell wall biosynthesis
MSSFREAFPNVLCESMSTSVPCVSTDVGDAKLIIGDSGWIVPVNDSLELANNIEYCYNLHSQNEIGKYGERSRKRVEDNFNFNDMVVNYQKVWDLYEI